MATLTTHWRYYSNDKAIWRLWTDLLQVLNMAVLCVDCHEYSKHNLYMAMISQYVVGILYLKGRDFKLTRLLIKRNFNNTLIFLKI